VQDGELASWGDLKDYSRIGCAALHGCPIKIPIATLHQRTEWKLAVRAVKVVENSELASRSNPKDYASVGAASLRRSIEILVGALNQRCQGVEP
jgi:hypothetical protein